MKVGEAYTGEVKGGGKGLEGRRERKGKRKGHGGGGPEGCNPT